MIELPLHVKFILLLCRIKNTLPKYNNTRMLTVKIFLNAQFVSFIFHRSCQWYITTRI